MKATKIAAFICLMLGVSTVWATDCSLPSMPELPNGKNADMQAMLAGKEAVTAFQAENSEYLGCLNEAIEASKTKLASGGDKPALKAIKAEYQALTDKYNAAVNAEETLANKFNDAIRAFKQANPSS